MHRRSREVVERAESVLAIALLVIVLGSAWFFGAVNAQVQSIIAFCLAGLLLLNVLLQARYQLVTRFADCPRLVWVLLAGLLIGMFQLVPLSTELVRSLAPGATAWRADQATRPGNDAGGSGRSMPADVGTSIFPFPQTRTIYAPNTRKSLAQLSMAVGACLLAMQLFSRLRIKWLMLGLAGTGVLLAIFGMVQKLQWDGRIYWTYPVANASPFGPFVNRNNAGGFLNLCVAGCVGWLVWHYATGRRREGQADYGAKGVGRFSATDLLSWAALVVVIAGVASCLLYTSPSPRDS